METSNSSFGPPTKLHSVISSVEPSGTMGVQVTSSPARSIGMSGRHSSSSGTCGAGTLSWTLSKYASSGSDTNELDPRPSKSSRMMRMVPFVGVK